MNQDNKRYLLGSIVTVNVHKVGQIISMTEEEVGVVYSDKTKELVPWHYIRPINLSPEYMKAIGFNLVKKIDHPHHTEYMMDTRINGKFYTSRGIVLKDRSIWNFNNVSVRYIHQVQSLIWIIEPSYNIDVTNQIFK